MNVWGKGRCLNSRCDVRSVIAITAITDGPSGVTF